MKEVDETRSDGYGARSVPDSRTEWWTTRWSEV